MWQEKLDGFWSSASTHSAQELRTELERLLTEPQIPQAIQLFERASLHDYLGEESLAVAPYRRALEAGLNGPKRSEALLQLASTLRNLGEYEQAIDLLAQITSQDPLFTDAQAFLALTLHDAGRTTEAVRTAVQALAPHLALYAGPIRRYAQDLGDTTSS